VKGCFVIGNGPSLNQVDVTRLSGFDTIAFNRSYVAWDRWGFAPTYYVCLDPAGCEQNVEGIGALIEAHPATRFFLNEVVASSGIRESGRVTLARLEQSEKFADDPRGLSDFGNVAATSIQLLHILGYRRVALIGIDARYEVVRARDADEEGWVRMERDPSHFYDTPVRRRPIDEQQIAAVLGGWPSVAAECARTGVVVRIASPGSALRVFPHIEYERALGWIGHD